MSIENIESIVRQILTEVQAANKKLASLERKIKDLELK